MAECFLPVSAALLLMGNTCVLLRGRAGMEERLILSSLGSAQPGGSGHGAPRLSRRELPMSELCIRPHSPGQPPGTVCGRFCPGSAVSWLSPSGPAVVCVSIMSAITVTQENLLSASGIPSPDRVLFLFRLLRVVSLSKKQWRKQNTESDTQRSEFKTRLFHLQVT